jgi:hypothetical protein
LREWQNLPSANRPATPISQYISKNAVTSFVLRNLRMTFTIDFIASLKTVSLPPNAPNLTKVGVSLKIENGMV